jgi:hypothetical protein
MYKETLIKSYVVKIECCASGRLLLSFKKRAKDEDMHQESVFYTDRRLRQLGWSRANGIPYANYDENLHGLIPPFTKSNQKPSESQQQLKLNHYVECLYKNKFYAACVVDLVPNVYFILKLDCFTPVYLAFYYNDTDLIQEISDMDDCEDLDFVYNNSFHTLFPCKWCANNNLNIEPPAGWKENGPFEWTLYQEKYVTTSKMTSDDSDSLSQVFTKPGPDVHGLLGWCKDLGKLSEKFQTGMYLEYETGGGGGTSVVLAQVKARVAHLLFLKRVDSYADRLYELDVVSVDSSCLHPVGWCEMNDYYRRLGIPENECRLPFGDFERGRRGSSGCDKLLDERQVAMELARLRPSEVALGYLSLIKGLLFKIAI